MNVPLSLPFCPVRPYCKNKCIFFIFDCSYLKHPKCSSTSIILSPNLTTSSFQSKSPQQIINEMAAVVPKCVVLRTFVFALHSFNMMPGLLTKEVICCEREGKFFLFFVLCYFSFAWYTLSPLGYCVAPQPLASEAWFSRIAITAYFPVALHSRIAMWCQLCRQEERAKTERILIGPLPDLCVDLSASVRDSSRR
jgi:hypothetical protein